MSDRKRTINTQAVVFTGNKSIFVVLSPVNKSQSVIEPLAL